MTHFVIFLNYSSILTIAVDYIQQIDSTNSIMMSEYTTQVF